MSIQPRSALQEIRRAARALDRAHQQLAGRPAINTALAAQAQPATASTPIAWPPRMQKIDGGAVLLPDFGLMFSAEAPSKAKNWAEAKLLAAECLLLGHDDWRLPECHELELLIRRDRSQPAIDTEFVPNTPTNDWYWSATPYAPSPSDVAWSVDFSSGYVYHYDQRDSGFVRPVRRVSSGQ